MKSAKTSVNTTALNNPSGGEGDPSGRHRRVEEYRRQADDPPLSHSGRRRGRSLPRYCRRQRRPYHSGLQSLRRRQGPGRRGFHKERCIGEVRQDLRQHHRPQQPQRHLWMVRRLPRSRHLHSPLYRKGLPLVPPLPGQGPLYRRTGLTRAAIPIIPASRCLLSSEGFCGRPESGILASVIHIRADSVGRLSCG